MMNRTVVLYLFSSSLLIGAAMMLLATSAWPRSNETETDTGVDTQTDAIADTTLEYTEGQAAVVPEETVTTAETAPQ